MQINREKIIPAMVGAMAIAGAAQTVSAESLPIPSENEAGWRFSVTPYLFLPFSTSGTSTIDGQSVDIDLDLGEVLDLLQGAASIRFEAWNDDWGIISDFYYVYIEDEGSVDFPNGGNIDATATTKQGRINLMGAYRFADGSNAQGRRYSVDASAGVQWNSLEQTIDYDASGPPGSGISRGGSIGGTETWFEPVVGLRGAMEISERWTLGARTELSGFGVNGNDLQYLVLFGADWRAWERTSLKFGYQFYGIDYSTDRSGGKFAYDVDQNGAYVGLTFRF